MPDARLALIALTLVPLLGAPAASFGAEGKPEAPAAVAADPFCASDVDPDALDPVDDVIAEDPAPAPGDVLDIDVPDEPVDLAGVLDFCAEGPVTAPVVLPFAKVRSARTVDAGTINLAARGALVRDIRLAAGAVPKALKPYRTMSWGTAKRASAPEGFVELPVSLNKKGRKALSLARGDVRLVVRTTLRLAGGASRTRTQTVVLRRAAR